MAKNKGPEIIKEITNNVETDIYGDWKVVTRKKWPPINKGANLKGNPTQKGNRFKGLLNLKEGR